MGDAQKILDRIAYEIENAARDAQNTWQRGWKTRPAWKPVRDARTVVDGFKRMPARLSDLATDGSCAMRYLFGYCLKGFAALQGFAGLIAAVTAVVGHHTWQMEQLSVGLLLLATAQLIWWAGHLVHRSADRKRYAQYQHRLLKLAREKGGSLTVLEAATDGRMTVEKTEEILRELAVRGHAEVRVSDSGLIVYFFPEIERWDEKHRAKPVHEL